MICKFVVSSNRLPHFSSNEHFQLRLFRTLCPSMYLIVCHLCWKRSFSNFGLLLFVIAWHPYSSPCMIILKTARHHLLGKSQLKYYSLVSHLRVTRLLKLANAIRFGEVTVLRFRNFAERNPFHYSIAFFQSDSVAFEMTPI